ncbi:MAG: tRNA (5-methylaminomethyl-2-thiouridylate)-methyltransferase, partial [Gammaproteobacteria bacterium]|nr:tRNA (5-methylaminomethyl-2-thiouridylate)-methyltransferase [Gammaproteobacteria bacterium]
RHIRPAPHYKLIVSREEGENNFLLGYRKQFIHLFTTSHPGPLALLDGEPSEADLELAARIVARYGKGRTAEQVTVEVHFPDGESRTLEVTPLLPHEVKEEWMV